MNQDIYSHTPVSILTLRNPKTPKMTWAWIVQLIKIYGRLELQKETWLLYIGMAERAKTRGSNAMHVDTTWSDNSYLLG